MVDEWELRACRNDDPVSGLASLPDKSVDVTIMDPPYEEDAHTKQRRCRDVLEGRARSAELTFPPITEEERMAVASEIGRVTRRWVLVFCQVEGAHLWHHALETGGMEYVRTMVWIKPDGAPQFTGDRPGMGYESIVVAHPPGRKRWNGGGRRGVLQYLTGKNTSGHPTQKPLALMQDLVELFSDAGELVCDPYAGSGTTGIACRMLGRRFLGWESDVNMAEIAHRRIAGDRAVPSDQQMEMF